MKLYSTKYIYTIKFVIICAFNFVVVQIEKLGKVIVRKLKSTLHGQYIMKSIILLLIYSRTRLNRGGLAHWDTGKFPGAPT